MGDEKGGYILGPHIGKGFVETFKENIDRMAKEAVAKGHRAPPKRVYRPENYEYEGDDA